MVRKKHDNFLNRLALLTTGIAIGIIFIIVFLNFSKHWAVVIGLINISVFILGYFFIKLSYNYNTKAQIDLLILSIENLFSLDYQTPLPNDEFKEAYEELANIREKLKKQNDDRTKILDIVNSVASNIDLYGMLEDLLPKFLDITNSNCGAFYLANNSTEKLEIKHSLGFNKNVYSEFDITIGEGLIGDLSDRKNIKIINDIPKDTIYVSRTFLGNIQPKSIMVIPVSNNDELAGVLVLSSIFQYGDESIEPASHIQYYMSIAIGNSITLANNKKLNNELKFQNKLIHEFNEELEKMAAERNLLFDNIINSIQEYAIYTMDKNGIVTTWNKGAENLSGFSAEYIIGKHCECIYPEEEVKNGLVSRRFNIVNNSGKFSETIWRNTNNGKKYYADTTLYSIKNENGSIIGYVNVTKDISDIKNMESIIASERKFSLMIIENSSMPLILCDFTGVITYSNSAARSLLSMDSTELNELAFSDIAKDSEEIHRQAITAVSTGKVISLSNIAINSRDLRINLQIVPFAGKLYDTGVIFAFNKYIKNYCESVNWAKE